MILPDVGRSIFSACAIFSPESAVPRIIRQSYARKGATRALGPLNRPLHPLNHALHIPRLFAFEDSEFAAAGGASRYKIKLFMRSQHQMVTLAHPCHVITQCTAIRFIAFFPLNRHIFIKSGHFAPHSTTLCFSQASYPKPVKTSSRDSAPETVKMHSIPAQVVIGSLLLLNSAAENSRSAN